MARSRQSVGRYPKPGISRLVEGVHDTVLNRLIEIAYNQNLTLVSASTKVLEARAQLGVAIGEFYPQIQGPGTATYIGFPGCRAES